MILSSWCLSSWASLSPRAEPCKAKSAPLCRRDIDRSEIHCYRIPLVNEEHSYHILSLASATESAICGHHCVVRYATSIDLRDKDIHHRPRRKDLELTCGSSVSPCSDSLGRGTVCYMTQELVKLSSERSQDSLMQKKCGIFPHLFYTVSCAKSYR